MLALKNILVATDFSEPSEAALAYGRAFARQWSATLHVLHVVDDLSLRLSPMGGPVMDLSKVQTELETDARKSLQDLITDDDRRTLHVRACTVTSATPAQEILTYAKDQHVDLLIVGTHGRTGMAHFFMGSVAQHIVRSAPCPVLTVRHKERDFLQPDALQKA
jgi:nucleotide-binding universal stress UspA family protein